MRPCAPALDARTERCAWCSSPLVLFPPTPSPLNPSNPLLFPLSLFPSISHPIPSLHPHAPSCTLLPPQAIKVMESHRAEAPPPEGDQLYPGWKHRKDMSTMLLEPGMVDRCVPQGGWACSAIVRSQAC